MSSRAYDNAGRAEAARITRRRILAVAREMLADRGYTGLSVAELARQAGVSPQTIYNSVGGKADVLKACYDVTLAGDDEPIPMNERPEARAMTQATTAREFVRRYATWCRTVSERVHPIVSAFIRPGTSDAGIAGFVATIEQERRKGTTFIISMLADRFGLREGLTLDRAVDAVWALNSPEVYDRLIGRCGWTPGDYEHWLAGQLNLTLVG